MIDEGEEAGGVHEGLAPFGVGGCAGFGGDDFVECFALLFESGDFFANSGEDVAEKLEIRFAADFAVAGNDDGGVCDFGEVGFGGADLAVNAATGGVVDEGIVAVPEGVAGMEDVGFDKMDVNVGIGVGGRVMVHDEGGIIDVEGVGIVKDDRGQRSSGHGGKGVMPAFDASVLREMFLGVGLGENRGAGFMNPEVSAGMVEVPVGIDELLDGIGIDFRQSGRDVWARGDDFRVHEELSVGAGEDGDVAAGSEERDDIAAKRAHGDGHGWRDAERVGNEMIFFGEKTRGKGAGSQSDACCREKSPARDGVRRGECHLCRS